VATTVSYDPTIKGFSIWGRVAGQGRRAGSQGRVAGAGSQCRVAGAGSQCRITGAGSQAAPCTLLLNSTFSSNTRLIQKCHANLCSTVRISKTLFRRMVFNKALVQVLRIALDRCGRYAQELGRFAHDAAYDATKDGFVDDVSRKSLEPCRLFQLMTLAIILGKMRYG
jgi:hypothetical protein